MLRGTRTQYMRRIQRFGVLIVILSGCGLFAVPMTLSSGWQRIASVAIALAFYIWIELFAIARLADKQWYRERAQLQREAGKHRGPISFRLRVRTKGRSL